jgi:hypothetical protein
MRSIDHWLDRFASRHPRFGISNLMYWIIGGTVAVYILDRFSAGAFTGFLDFYPAAIFSGQVWRLVTFIFVPNTYRIIWFAVSMFFYAFLGPFMERNWGTAKFTLFYGCGVVLCILFGLLSYAITGLNSMPTASIYYVNLSLFLAFATLYPEAPLQFYFVIPVKAKWLAVLDILMMVWDIVGTPTYMLGIVLPALLPSMLASLVNYAIFFWSDLRELLGIQRSRARHQTSHQTIQFKAAVKQQAKKAQEQGYRHKCEVCGRTDADFPDLEFRYCSKCAGYHCFCQDHIYNHTHFQK